MQKLTILFLTLMIGITFGCTRDDICSEATQTTPLVIITFKDAINPVQSKSVSNLTITTTDEPSNDIMKSATTDSISIPLKSNMDITRLLFIEGDTEESDGNPDTVTFNYLRENIYVNRACAYKTIYKEISIAIDPENNTNWILNSEVLLTNVENENQTHITIFH
jgi:hypothetical protein